MLALNGLKIPQLAKILQDYYAEAEVYSEPVQIFVRWSL